MSGFTLYSILFSKGGDDMDTLNSILTIVTIAEKSLMIYISALTFFKRKK